MMARSISKAPARLVKKKKKKKEIVFLTQVQKLISMEVSHIVALYKFPIAYAKSWSKYRR